MSTAQKRDTANHLPYYPFYPRDYWCDMFGISNQADLLYRRLIDLFWILDGKMPHDPDALCKEVRYSRDEFDQSWPQIEKFWYDEGGYLYNKRILFELEKAKVGYKQRVQAGMASVAARKLKSERGSHSTGAGPGGRTGVGTAVQTSVQTAVESEPNVSGAEISEQDAQNSGFQTGVQTAVQTAVETDVQTNVATEVERSRNRSSFKKEDARAENLSTGTAKSETDDGDAETATNEVPRAAQEVRQDGQSGETTGANRESNAPEPETHTPIHETNSPEPETPEHSGGPKFDAWWAIFPNHSRHMDCIRVWHLRDCDSIAGWWMTRTQNLIDQGLWANGDGPHAYEFLMKQLDGLNNDRVEP